MRDINLIVLQGNLGQDAEAKHFPDGGLLVRLSLATNRNYKDKQGQWQTITQWHAIVVRGASAERAAQLTKGTRVLVQGEMTYRVYEKDGAKRKVAEVSVSGPGQFVADQTPRDQGNGQGQSAATQPTSTTTPSASTEGWDDDIPF